MRKLLFVLIAVVMLSVFTGCSQSGTTQTDEESAEDSGEVYNVSYATAMAPASDFHQEVELVILNMLEEKSGGRFKTEAFTGNSLAGFGTGIDAVLNDMVTMCFDNFGAYSGRYPLADMFNMAGMGTPSGEAGCAIFRDYLNTIGASEAAGLKVITPVHTGPMSLISIEPIASTADFAGKQIRVAGANTVGAFSALGASPVEMPVSDLYEALRLNVIDGLLASPDTIAAFNLKDVADYVTMMPEFGAGMFIVMSEDFYKSLPADLQKVVDEVSEEAFNLVKTFFDTKNAKTIEDSNMTLVEVTDEQHEEWSKIFQDNTLEYAKSLDDKGLPGTETFNWILEQLEQYK